MSTRIYDNHTLFVKCDCATIEQIRSAFTTALTTYRDANKISLDCRFRVNLVEDREGNSFGIAFVFVTNSEVYHILLGKNPDGSDRVEYRDDPSWSPPPKGVNVNDAGWSSISEPVYTDEMSWADVCEEEDRYDQLVQVTKNRNVCPKIAVPLNPLMFLPSYELSDEQAVRKRAKIIADNKGKPDFDEALIEVPRIAYFTVDRAMAPALDIKFMPNILKCRNIPPWVDKEDLKLQFAPYASDSQALQERTIKGRFVEETYPFVNISDERVGFIIFDSSTNDAQFALHMMKKTVIRKRVEDQYNTVTLIFGHSFRTDRDMMTDINQRPRPVQRRDPTRPPREDSRQGKRRVKKSPQGSIGNKFAVLTDE